MKRIMELMADVYETCISPGVHKSMEELGQWTLLYTSSRFQSDTYSIGGRTGGPVDGFVENSASFRFVLLI